MVSAAEDLHVVRVEMPAWVDAAALAFVGVERAGAANLGDDQRGLATSTGPFQCRGLHAGSLSSLGSTLRRLPRERLASFHQTAKMVDWT